jgi:hypothetical protein
MLMYSQPTLVLVLKNEDNIRENKQNFKVDLRTQHEMQENVNLPKKFRLRF